MCSRYAETQCSVCCRTLDKSTNRIIVEICGHQKCRECFIKEEEGCSICKAAPIEQHPSDEKIEESEQQNQSRIADKDEKRIDESKPAEKHDEESHIITVTQDGAPLSYKCTLCQKSFRSRNNRKYHLFCDKTRSKPFQCGICHIEFVTHAHLKYHQSTHDIDKRYSCQYCDRIYSGEIALKKHLRKHKNDFKYECEQCKEKFIYKEQLNIHRNRHNDVFHECPECGKRFLIKSNFTKHIQSHSGANRKTCLMCGNTFSGSSALKTHMLTHSKSKPHPCDRCEKKFVDHRTLERHQKTHSDDIVYECTMCSAKSNRRDNIRRHVRNLHSSSEKELQSILENILENFSPKQNQKLKKTEESVMEPSDTSQGHNPDVAEVIKEVCTTVVVDETEESRKPMNNTTSVIKFAGRTENTESIIIDLESRPNAEDQEGTIQIDVSIADTSIANEGRETTTTDSAREIRKELPSLNYEPLTFDPFPKIQPLPLLNTNNLTVYRQLLSPYLKKATISSEDHATSVARETTKEPNLKSNIVIDRPPKKMIEKYDIYRK